MSSVALFVTHHVFLTEEQIDSVAGGSEVDVTGHCVPVWINAKTGRTSEPASEIFCSYRVLESEKKTCDVEIVPRKGYVLYLPKSKWIPPENIDFQAISGWTSEERQSFLKERDKWWFNNPRPQDIENLKNGYLRFEVKKTNQKIGSKEYMTQHIIEISAVSRLNESLTS